MSRMIYVPMLPTAGRYTAWWASEFEKEFKRVYGEVIVLGKDYLFNLNIKRENEETFSNINNSISLEAFQINEYLNLELRSDDVLFLSDLSFPGLFANALFHKPFPGRAFAYCHATSKNAYDYFQKSRNIKFKVETAISKLFTKIFVGSYYHARKLDKWFGADKIEVVRLPHPPDSVIKKFPNKFRQNKVVCVGRPGIQKNNIRLENWLEKQLGFKFIRGVFTDPDAYSAFLSNSKVLFISSKEDTFNYTIMDAIACGVVPIAPNKLCFPEILHPAYLYNDGEDAYNIIRECLTGFIPVPHMLCKNAVQSFYRTITSIM